MKNLRIGDRGTLVQLLQIALERSQNYFGKIDGIFGAATEQAVRNFQRAAGITADGIVGENTQRALLPYYTGFTPYTIRSGDSIYQISNRFDTTVSAVLSANPGISIYNLIPGSTIIVPLHFNVVPTNISFGSTALSFAVRGLAARYPFITVSEIGRSVMGKPLYMLCFGRGENRVIYNASHHANEWITTPVLLKFIEDFSKAYIENGTIFGYLAEEIMRKSTVYLIPAVNPDGVDLVTGELDSGQYYELAKSLAANYPDIPFPDGWKANIQGVDTNLQYPAGWERAREIKFAQGFTLPGPRDYVGRAPLTALESAAMYDFTLEVDPNLTLAYHTQGEVIFWKYLDYEPAGSREIAQIFGEVSGYLVEETPYASGFAGYKDWFIERFDRPGYTIEAGLGENPLPIEQFDEIYEKNIGILALGTLLTAQ